MTATGGVGPSAVTRPTRRAKNHRNKADRAWPKSQSARNIVIELHVGKGGGGCLLGASAAHKDITVGCLRPDEAARHVSSRACSGGRPSGRRRARLRPAARHPPA